MMMGWGHTDLVYLHFCSPTHTSSTTAPGHFYALIATTHLLMYESTLIGCVLLSANV